MQILQMTHHDRGMIVRKLNHARVKQLIQYCRFAGVDPAVFLNNARQFFAFKLRLLETGPTYQADFSNTYIDRHITIPGKRAYIVFGVGLGNGMVYRLDQAVNGGNRLPPKQMVALDIYFQREYTTLNENERIKLALLILGSPGYSRRNDADLQRLFKRDARRIFCKLRQIHKKALTEFCSLTGIKFEEFEENLRDLE